ncbi:MAG: HAMP domain-containing sensor histidine kinase [Micromonosporaceae bacterium]
MRRRLLITYGTLLAAVLLGLAVPLALTLAARDTQTMFIDRLNDTARFASLAEPALRTGRTEAIEAELRQYDALFDIGVAVVGRDGQPVLTSRPLLDLDAPEVRRRIETALSGQRAALREVMWPWQSEPLVVAEPVGRGGEIIGAVLTVSPTGTLRVVTARSWLLLTAVGVVVLLVGAASAAPLARWMLRPVHDLDEAAHALTEGRFGERSVVASGPPELRRLTESFNTMSERIATLIERQRSFVSYASHQLRTPLATMRLTVENLGPAVAPEGAADYRMLSEEVERLAGICDALLTYARAEATAQDAQEMDAGAVADDRVAVWRPVAQRAGVRLVRADGPHARVYAASQVLDQALDALISNAVKFAGPGADVVVSVATRDNAWVEIEVADTGPGMSPEDLARAVDPFWRRGTDQNVEGSGLGVTIADALVRAAGGRLDLLPAHPRGVRARIRLPARPGTAGEADRVGEAERL